MYDPLVTCAIQVGAIFLDHDLERDSPLGLIMVRGFVPCRIPQHLNNTYFFHLSQFYLFTKHKIFYRIIVSCVNHLINRTKSINIYL